MNVLDVIDLCNHCPEFKFRDADFIRRAAQAKGQISRYIASDRGGKDADVLCMVDPMFINGFCRYLFAAEAYKQNGTVYRWISNFRRVCHKAMCFGFVPKVDVFPSVINSLLLDYPDDGPYAVRKSAKSFETKDFKNEFEKLVRYAGTNEAKLAADEEALHIYLFGIFCCGLEIRDIATLEFSEDEENNKILVIQKFGIEMPYDGVLKKLAEKANGKTYSGKKVFKIFEGKDKSESEAIAAKVEHRLVGALSKLKISLYASKSILSDWLSIALCNGASVDDISKIAHAQVENHLQSKFKREIENLAKCICDRQGYFTSHWRVLCSYSPALTVEKLEKRVCEIAKLAPNGNGAGNIHTYNPQEVAVKRVNGKIVRRPKSAMGRYLFVQCTLAESEAIEKHVCNASFLRKPDNHSVRAIVSDEEVHRLMAFIRDYGNEFAVVDLKGWAMRQEVSLAEGQKVKVKAGPYTGFEGIIISKKDKEDASGATKLFVVRIVGLPDIAIAGNVTASLRGLELQVI